MGVPVLADDVLIVDRGLRALAGPRCIDLRREAALALGIGESIGLVGTRERWRTPLGQVPCEVPLGGFVCLEWGEAAVSRLSPKERVRMLYANQALLLGEQRDSAMLSSLMELFALPMIRMRRPRADRGDREDGRDAPRRNRWPRAADTGTPRPGAADRDGVDQLIAQPV